MSAAVDAATVKACCTSVYEHEAAGWLLGESFHPGGTALTERLAELLDLSHGQRVLDVAAGRGASAVHLAASRDLSVHGVDLSPHLVSAARHRAEDTGVGARTSFEVGDAERLPLESEAFDAAICECALCLFPDKAGAMREIARVVRAGGRVGIADLVVDRRRLPPELDTLVGRVACLGDARTLEENLRLIEDAGLRVDVVERHDEALAGMIDRIDARLSVAAMVFPAEAVGLDLAAAHRLVAQARRVVGEGVAGYALIAATVPGNGHAG